MSGIAAAIVAQVDGEGAAVGRQAAEPQRPGRRSAAFPVDGGLPGGLQSAPVIRRRGWSGREDAADDP